MVHFYNSTVLIQYDKLPLGPKGPEFPGSPFCPVGYNKIHNHSYVASCIIINLHHK